MSIPESWTDDMSIGLPPTVTFEMVVDIILAGEAAKAPYEVTQARLPAPSRRKPPARSSARERSPPRSTAASPPVSAAG